MTLALWGCGNLWAADFLPLRFGNTWTYREARTGQEFTIRVGTPLLHNELVYYSLTGYTNARLLVRLNEFGNLVYLSEETDRDLLLTSFEPFEGGRWEANARPCEQEGQTRVKRSIHDGPAGPVNDVLDIQYRSLTCADAGLIAEQYAENIGMVRRVNTSIAGPRQFDLVSARVGNLAIDALPNSTFKIAVSKTPANGFYNIALQLKTVSPIPLTLQFRSSQEYDAILLDADGRIVWQWSADQVFAQVLHQRSVTGEWTAALRLPASVIGEDETIARTFTLQVWLTTTGITPAFAATHPISIGPAPAN
jgi:hypothetical protein